MIGFIRLIVFSIIATIGYSYGVSQQSVPLWTTIGVIVGVLIAFIDYTFKLVGEIVEGIFD